MRLPAAGRECGLRNGEFKTFEKKYFPMPNLPVYGGLGLQI
jgi:hypothetical protein